MPTKYVEVKGHATYVFHAGATTLPDVPPDLSRGRKIVLVHGAGGNGHRWMRVLNALAKSHSPVALDLPGHGRCSGVEGLSSIPDYSDFLAAFLDALKINSAVIAGWSMGGAIAMDFALRYPQRVEALVLVATAAKFAIPDDRIADLRAVTMGRKPPHYTTDGYSPRTIKENFDLIREGWMEQAKTDPRVRYTDIVACTQVNLTEVIQKIDRPTLVVAGADDQGTTVAQAETIKNRIRGAQLQVIADAGHIIPCEQPAALTGAIENFLAGLR
ncbi:MAG TPA: alpha/beta fold hydrolase [Candidatus Binataceae bacterium]|nr:alpha/beta fold hydrolase [Candidatus Binataceae bacterium]